MAQIVHIVGLFVVISAGAVSPVSEPRGEFHSRMESDLSATFFSDFAENIRYTHACGPTEIYSGIIDIASADSSILSDSSILDYKPAIQIRRAAMISPPAKGDKVQARGSRYRVDNYADDGVGVITVYLARV